MRSLNAAEAFAVNRSGGSQIRSTWQSAEMTSYFIALSSSRSPLPQPSAWEAHLPSTGHRILAHRLDRKSRVPAKAGIHYSAGWCLGVGGPRLSPGRELVSAHRLSPRRDVEQRALIRPALPP